MKSKKRIVKRKARTYRRKRTTFGYSLLGSVVKVQITQSYPIVAHFGVASSIGWYTLLDAKSKPGTPIMVPYVTPAYDGALPNSMGSQSSYFRSPGYTQKWQELRRDFQYFTVNAINLKYVNTELVQSQVVMDKTALTTVPSLALKIFPSDVFIAPKNNLSSDNSDIMDALPNLIVQPSNAASHGTNKTFRMPSRILFPKDTNPIQQSDPSPRIVALNAWNNIQDFPYMDWIVAIGFKTCPIQTGVLTDLPAKDYTIGELVVTTYIHACMPLLNKQVFNPDPAIPD